MSYATKYIKYYLMYYTRQFNVLARTYLEQS
jgi:hypothetical protein